MEDDKRYNFEYFKSPLNIANAFNYDIKYYKHEIISVVYREFDKQYVVFYK